MKTLDPEPLKRFIASLFARAGCGDEEAVVIADHLVLSVCGLPVVLREFPRYGIV